MTPKTLQLSQYEAIGTSLLFFCVSTSHPTIFFQATHKNLRELLTIDQIMGS